jgi:TIR domain
MFADNDLSEVKGLETVDHGGPSSIGIDTLYKSVGKIPEAFLRGCGVPDDFITYFPSLIGVQQAIQFYSCFISYSTRDEQFARRLYSRMRDEKLRVWFAPEDIKGGEKLYDQIERAIQLHDRLLLVLSESSRQSEWVITEIQRAREAEMKENRRKLFPISIVGFDQVKAWKRFDADSGKDLAREVREYFIPDFSNWKDHDAFEQAFARLLRDLRDEETKATSK